MIRIHVMCNQTWGRQTAPRQPRQMTFTSTKVPKFGGVTSWEQYRQVVDANAQSNGWGDATVALQLLSHLEGDTLNDTLNVALLVPQTRRAMIGGTDGALRVARPIGGLSPAV